MYYHKNISFLFGENRQKRKRGTDDDEGDPVAVRAGLRCWLRDMGRMENMEGAERQGRRAKETDFARGKIPSSSGVLRGFDSLRPIAAVIRFIGSDLPRGTDPIAKTNETG